MRLTVLDLPNYDPVKNLALESSLPQLVEKDELIFRLWQNNPCIVIGRFQKEEYEVNLPFCSKINIPILRRLSGGGTVFHDLGVLNISFVQKINLGQQAGLAKRFLTIIDQVMQQFNIETRIDWQRKAIFVREKKILGSAMLIAHGAFLFHCSVLVCANLDHLKNCINWSPNYQEQDHKFVSSHRSSVINLGQLNPQIEISILKKALIEQLKQEIQFIDTKTITSCVDRFSKSINN